MFKFTLEGHLISFELNKCFLIPGIAPWLGIRYIALENK